MRDGGIPHRDLRTRARSAMRNEPWFVSAGVMGRVRIKSRSTQHGHREVRQARARFLEKSRVRFLAAAALRTSRRHLAAWLQLLTGTGASPTIGPASVIPPFATSDAERPSVNQIAAANGAAITWVVAYQSYNNAISGDDWDVLVHQVNAGGSVLGTWTPTGSAGGPTSHRLGPQIAGLNGRYGVAFSRSTIVDVPFKTTVINGHAFDFERFDWQDGAPVISITRHPPVEHFPYANDRRWETGACAYDHDSRSHWAYTNRSNANFGGSGISYIARTGYTGARLETATIFPTSTSDQALQGGIAFDDDADLMFVAYGDQPLAGQTSATNQQVFLASFTYPTPPAAVTVAGSSCSRATISWTGTGAAAQQIGSQFWGPQVTNASASSAHLIVLSLSTANMPISGAGIGTGCRLLASLGSGYVGILPLQGGASVSVPLPLPEFLGATTLYFQDFHTNATGSVFLSTQRLEVPLTK